MNEENRNNTVQIAVSDEKGTDQNETALQDERDIAGEKPLEEMSKAELIQKASELQEKVDKNYDLYLRSHAELENVIKRNKKEKEDWIKYSNETLIKELLPVLDSLEKAIAFSDNKNSFNALKEGVELTLKGLKEALMKSGLAEVEAEGKPFDPAYHHAVSQQDDASVDPGTILQELQKGYMLNQRLVRPSMVVLSKATPRTEHDREGNNE